MLYSSLGPTLVKLLPKKKKMMAGRHGVRAMGVGGTQRDEAFKQTLCCGGVPLSSVVGNEVMASRIVNTWLLVLPGHP